MRGRRRRERWRKQLAALLSVRYGLAPGGLALLAEDDEAFARYAQRFLADYEAQRLYGRYVAASLPRLPFFDATFDLVLCAHLLFTYAQRFDFDWHLAACRERARAPKKPVSGTLLGISTRDPSRFTKRNRRVGTSG